MTHKSDEGEKKTVRARRRRRTTTSGERERAEAPRRERSDDQEAPAPPPSRASSTARRSSRRVRRRSSGGTMPAGLRLSPLMMVGLLVVACICIAAFMLLSGSDDSGLIVSDFPTATFEPLAPPATNRPRPTTEPFVAPSTSTEGQTWLVMLYQVGDDKILEQDIYLDLNEAERIGSTDRVQIVAQMDRYRAGYQGDGDWDSTRRFYVTQDGNLTQVNSDLVQDLGEANMSDGETLVDFVTWAVDTFPADKHVLILSGHGLGWPGGWSDSAPGGRGDPDIPLASRLGDELYLMELDQALGEIREQTGLEQFELIGMDACLMSHLEVYSALAPHARYAVASQETEPALGWAYTGFLGELARNPDMDGAELGRQIVDSYIQDDQRIVDDQARAEFLKKGSPLGGLVGLLGGPTAEQLAEQMEQNVTLTAINLAALPDLVDSVNELVYALQGTKQQPVARARSYAQSFTSVFGRDVPPSYIDLGNFVQLLRRESGDSKVAQAADQVLASLDRAVVAERHGPQKPGASGISVYFPNSQLYQSPLAGPQSYTAIAERFADVSLWDDFLTYHYTGRPFERTASELVTPEQGATVRAPGAGQVTASPIIASSDVAAPGQPLLLSTDISGENIGYIYFFTGFYDQESNSIFLADRDYLESADTRQIDGVYYPVWPEGEFTLEFEWEPLIFAIDDGVDSVTALFTPQSYGASFEETTYTVDGIYTHADGGSQYARLYFRDEHLRQVFGFTDPNGTGAPREILPQPGDQFTVLDRWLDLDQNGQVVKVTTLEGGTLTFGDQIFAWKELDAAPGEYVVGFVVEDLDGNATEVYTEVTVE